MAQTFYTVTPVDVTPGVKDSWTDVNVDAYAPSGATGVILHITNTGYTSYALGLRKNGSTDNRKHPMSDTTHCWAMMGIDANRIFEAYVGTSITLYLVGYTTAGVTFFTNAYNKNPASAGSWQDVNCSAQCPNAVGLIFEVVSLYQYQFGFRKNGSTDDRKVQVYSGHDCFTVVIGCDASQICEIYFQSLNYQGARLVGYITDGAEFHTNAVDVSLGATGSWIDLASLPESSVMGIYENIGANYFGLRENGSSENIFVEGVHTWGIVACADGIVEGKIGDINRTTFEIGYATIEAGEAIPQAVNGTLTFAGSLSTARIRIVSQGGAITPAGALSRSMSKNVAGLIMPVGITKRQTFKSLAGEMTPAGSLTKMTRKIVSGVLTLSGTLTKLTGKVLDGALDLAGNVLKSTSKALGGALSPSGGLTPSKIFIQAVGGGLTFAGAVATSIVSITAQAVGGALTFAGSVSTVIIHVVDISAGLSFVGDLVKQTSKNLIGSITPSGVLTAGSTVYLAIGGTLTLAGEVLKSTTRTLGGLIKPVGMVSKYTRKLIGGTLTLSGVLKKTVSKILSGILSLAGNLPSSGRDLTMRLFTRPYRNVSTKSKPYRDMTSEAKED